MSTADIEALKQAINALESEKRDGESRVQQLRAQLNTARAAAPAAALTEQDAKTRELLSAMYSQNLPELQKFCDVLTDADFAVSELLKFVELELGQVEKTFALLQPSAPSASEEPIYGSAVASYSEQPLPA